MNVEMLSQSLDMPAAARLARFEASVNR